MDKLKLIVLTLTWIVITVLPALAGDFDGSRSLLGAVISVVECGPGGGCEQVTVEDIDIPRFIRINFTEKTISATPESGIERCTQIKRMERIDGKLILQGAEDGGEGVKDGVGWSMAIVEETGSFVKQGGVRSQHVTFDLDFESRVQEALPLRSGAGGLSTRRDREEIGTP